MWIECTTYNVMDGEPHLGKVTECELMGDDAIDYIVDYIMEMDEVPDIVVTIDDYSDEDIDLEVADFIDIEAVRDYVDLCEQEGRDLVREQVLALC